MAFANHSAPMGSGHSFTLQLREKGLVYEINGAFLVLAAFILLFIVILFYLILFLSPRLFSRRSAPVLPEAYYGHSSARRFNFAGEDPFSLQGVGLAPSVIENLPTFGYKSEHFKDGSLDCAVCLCELEENEKARVLPECNHSFHVECIDMWFHSHSTCPLCRASVHPDSPWNAVESGSVLQISGNNNSVAEEPTSASHSVDA